MSDCPICLDNFSASSSQDSGPVIGKCGHSFCRLCITKLHVSACEMFNPRIRNLACPSCKEEKAFRSDRLVTNWSLIQMIESSAESNEKDKQIEALESKNRELAKRMESANQTVTKLQAKNNAACAEAAEKDAKAAGLLVKINKKDSELRMLETKLKRQCSELKEKDSELRSKDAKIEMICAELCRKDAELNKKKVTMKLTTAMLRADLNAKCKAMKKLGVTLRSTKAKLRDDLKATCSELKRKDLELQTDKVRTEENDGKNRVKSTDEAAAGREENALTAKYKTTPLRNEPEIIDLCGSDDEGDDEPPKIVEVRKEAAKIQADSEADSESWRNERPRQLNRYGYVKPNFQQKRRPVKTLVTNTAKKRKFLPRHTVAQSSNITRGIVLPILQHPLAPLPAQQIMPAYYWPPQLMLPQPRMIPQPLLQRGWVAATAAANFQTAPRPWF